MGCIESRSRIGVLDDKKALKFGNYQQIINEKCPKIRTDTIQAVKPLRIETQKHIIELKYAYVSQRGYYPHALGKANQDSYTICESMLGDDNCHFFGIFDGHGEHGDHCSYYCAEKVPHFLQQAMIDKGGTHVLNNKKIRDEIFYKSFDTTDISLHQSNIEDNLSGTTGITILIKDTTLHVANVGDSRAIIAGHIDGYLKYSPLSSDQTPYRADERERLKKCGATIMTLDQLEGREPIHENWGAETGDTIDETGDPPRVWDKSLERPGCAFTRSFGDAVAEIVGVNAIPEILTWDLSSLDKYIIIASDGVFEFLTSQNVVNIISQYQDIIEGARHVVEESYRLWLTYDERTDDISIIIISIDSFIDKKSKGLSSSMLMKSNSTKAKSNPNENKSGYSTYSNIKSSDNKPVRRVISKVRRKEISENWVSDDDYDYDFNRHVVKKTPEELARIANMVKTNFMFQSLSPVQRDQLFQVMELRYVIRGQRIIKQGDEGDEMYIVDSGEFLCTKKDENGVTQPVLSYTTPGSSFGELSLMYGKPRAASVEAVSDGRLWVLGRKAYRAVLVKRKQDDLLLTMQSIPVLNDLSFIQLQRLCETSIEKNFNDGEIILYESNDGSMNHHPGPSTILTPKGRILSTALTTTATTVTTTESSSKKRNLCLTVDTTMYDKHTEKCPNEEEFWIVCIILSGRIELIGKDGNKNRYRKTRSYVASVELGKYYSSMKAEGRVKLAYVTLPQYLDIAGEKMRQQLIDAIVSRNAVVPMSPIIVAQKSTKQQQKTMISKPSASDFFAQDDDGYSLIKSDKSTTRDEHQLDHAIATIGEFSYVGNFVILNKFSDAVQNTNKRLTGKVIAKKRAAINHMDAKLLQEKQILNYMKGDSFCLPMIISIIQDSRSILILYDHFYTCDLSIAITNNLISNTSRLFYLACIFSALKTLHANGIIHRFINIDSIFITDRGIAHLYDMRYAKRMNGSKSFTICGNPLYFAPEMITGQGYNYAVDLWSLGVLAYELFEGKAPIATVETDETTIFNKITMFRNTELSFIKESTSDVAKDFIRCLMNPDVSKRLGYRSAMEINDHAFFRDIKWETLHLSAGFPVTVNATVDPTAIFNEADLEEYSSAVFDRF